MSGQSKNRSARKRKHQTVTSSKSNNNNNNNNDGVYDMMIPLPKESASIQIRNLLHRLGDTGFTHAALTHTVFGIPRENQDEANTAIPETLWPSGGGKPKVLRRLNAVVENLSDLSHYTQRKTTTDTTPAISKSANILQGYDVVSICPRNEGVFQSACKSAMGSDILVLDYTCGRGGVQLPFKIKSADVKAAIARKAVFEIPYAPAILNRNQRKGLIQTCRLLQIASLGLKPKIVLSSGSRAVLEGEDDAGVMALRTPGDLKNLMEVVLKLDARIAYEAQHTACRFALEQSHIRRFGKQSITITGMAVMEAGDVTEGRDAVEEKPKESKLPLVASVKKEGKVRSATASVGSDKSHSGDEDGGEDGFIAF